MGQVNFCDAWATYCTDIYLLGTAQLTSAGTAALKFIPGISGSYKAVFVGTPNGASDYAGSVSSAMPLALAGTNPTTTTIAAGGSAGNYKLTATVTGSVSAAPLGDDVAKIIFEVTTHMRGGAASTVEMASLPALSFGGMIAGSVLARGHVNATYVACSRYYRCLR